MSEQRTRGTSDESAWPYASILLFGYFGSGTPEGRRLAHRTTAALAAFLVCAVGVQSMPVVPAWVWIVGLALSVIAIGVSYTLYLRALDELAQLLQLKAFAAAYGFIMTIAAALFGLSVAVEGALSPPQWLALLVFAEPLRSLALAYLVRKYA